MGIETILVIAAVAMAAAYLARQSMRSANGQGCAGGCGACANKHCAGNTAKKIPVRVFHP
jgi:hypothetical protein